MNVSEIGAMHAFAITTASSVHWQEHIDAVHSLSTSLVIRYHPIIFVPVIQS